MSNLTLVLLIAAAILAQVAAIGLFNWQRQRIRFQAYFSTPKATLSL